MQQAGHGGLLSPLAWGFALALAGYPVVGQVAGLTGIVDETLSNAFRIATAAVCALAFLRAGPRRVIGVDPAWGLFLALYVLRLTIDWAAGVPQVATFALYLLVLSILPAIGITASLRTWSTRSAVIAVLAVSALSTLLAVVVPTVSGGQEYFVTGRLAFEKVNPITLGHAAVTLIIAVAAVWQHLSSKAIRQLMVGLVVVGLICIYQASSRGPVVAAVGCIAIYIIFRVRLWWVTLPAAAGWALVAFEPWEEVSQLMDGLRLSTVGSDLSSLERINAYNYAWQAFIDNPGFGEASVMGDGWYPHNLFLETAMTMGLPGLVVLAVLVVKASVVGVRMVKRGEVFLPMLYFQALIGAQFSGALWGNAAFWITSSVLLGHNNLRKKSSAQRRAPRAPTSLGYGAGR